MKFAAVGVGALFLLLVAAIAAALYPQQRALAPDVSLENREEPAKLLFVGDMFFDRSIRTTAEERGYDFLLSCVKDRFDSYDLVVGNLEGPITEQSSVSVGSVIGSWQNFTFTFAPEVASLLARHNVKAVSLGNNHIGNMGEDGVVSTREHLDLAGVGHFGGIELLDEKPTEVGEPVYRTELKGEALSFIAYNQFGGMSPEEVVVRIAAEKEDGRLVVVMAHWGEEYIPPVSEVRRAARLFAEAGADIVIGAHPHVVQEREIIGDTPVYYSLGNFLFDQFFSEEVRRGLAVEVHIQHGLVQSTAEYPTEMLRDRRVCFEGDLNP